MIHNIAILLCCILLPIEINNLIKNAAKEAIKEREKEREMENDRDTL